jgi:hypothetical protein
MTLYAANIFNYGFRYMWWDALYWTGAFVITFAVTMKVGG